MVTSYKPAGMNAAFTLSAEDHEAARLLAQSADLRRAGEHMQAESCLQQAIELKYDFAEAHLALGDLYAAAGADEDALDCYQLAVHFSPYLYNAQLALAAALTRQQRHDEAAVACRAAIALDEVAPSAWFLLGNVRKAAGDLPSAADAYRAAVRADSSDLDALHQLAFVESRLGRYEEAYQNFRRLLEAVPDSPRAHHNFGLWQLECGYAEEALASFRRAHALQPEEPASLACIGHALRDLARLDEAIATYDKILATQADFPDVVGNRSQALLMRADWPAGWDAYEQRFGPGGAQARTRSLPRWRGMPLSRKKIVVLPEQGIGDEILFASCLPDLIATAGACVVECNARLVKLFARSFPKAQVCAADTKATTASTMTDFEISAGSLPQQFRRDTAAFPKHAGYLKVDTVRRIFWHDNGLLADARIRIGMAWRGGTLRNRQYLRSLNLPDLLPVLQTPDCAFISLQHGDYADEIHTLRERQGIDLRMPQFNIATDLDELAAMISALDLVITVDNTIANLAGALGVPVWVLLPFSAEWRYGLNAETMPWYPSARLFRQLRPRDWTPVIDLVAVGLRNFSPQACA
jgi:tetratricopeptide (TPR) repeat protein